MSPKIIAKNFPPAKKNPLIPLPNDKTCAKLYVVQILRRNCYILRDHQ